MRTRVTELLGIQYPILQGGMAWVATAPLVAAVSEAGGLGYHWASGGDDRRGTPGGDPTRSFPYGSTLRGEPHAPFSPH